MASTHTCEAMTSQNLREALPPLILNGVTAGPLLNLLLAMRGEEPPNLDAAVAWDVFKLFCSLPAEGVSDVISFQATWFPEDIEQRSDPPLFYCTWSREITVETEYGPSTRAIQVKWAFDPQVSDLDEVALWSDSTPDLATFFGHGEETREFVTLTREATVGDVYSLEVE
jgi:hypothetical protein